MEESVYLTAGAKSYFEGKAAERLDEPDISNLTVVFDAYGEVRVSHYYKELSGAYRSNELYFTSLTDFDNWINNNE